MAEPAVLLPSCIEQHFAKLLATTAPLTPLPHSAHQSPLLSPNIWAHCGRYFTGPSISLSTFIAQRVVEPLLSTEAIGASGVSATARLPAPQAELVVEGIMFKLYERADHPDFSRWSVFARCRVCGLCSDRVP